jgi:hypothetical protein
MSSFQFEAVLDNPYEYSSLFWMCQWNRTFLLVLCKDIYLHVFNNVLLMSDHWQWTSCLHFLDRIIVIIDIFITITIPIPCFNALGWYVQTITVQNIYKYSSSHSLYMKFIDVSISMDYIFIWMKYPGIVFCDIHTQCNS